MTAPPPLVSTLVLVALVAAGCAPPSPRERALGAVKSFIQSNLDDLERAAIDLQNAAPAPRSDGWNATSDAAAVAAMKAAWKRARAAYEHVEGAIAVLFDDLDVATDARYDAFIATQPDDYLFDDRGVTGIHAIERIVWSDLIPDRVKTFESALPGYKAAAFPANLMEASDFKQKLCGRLVADVGKMQSGFAPLALDPATAYRGVIGSMNEQLEKANKAATGEEESRYAQYTLADMRANVDAGVQTYAAFRDWILASGGAALDVQIRAGFTAIQNQYASYAGDALPPVPSTWSATNPSPEDLSTPFGQLYQLLQMEANPTRAGGLVSAMNQSADLIGVPRL
jgi:iron uptake system component EfeO